ncbi:MAG: 16S rRNA (uracil(1498)-N(3))-methyltransferase [Candidatus Saganbacteria bacterium]|nr:16S rRNA (uracil(1498)-N(3))-methyltransferase [Candidatus Saganbacteria bacterium]
MSAPRVFVHHDQIGKEKAEITGSDVNHLKNVLRLDKIICKIIGLRSHKSEPSFKITIAQGIPKAKKMDLIIEKGTELGVSAIIPTLCERSIPKPQADKLERWKRIAKEAAEQCGRLVVPQIHPITKFEDVLNLKEEYDLALIPWEIEKENSLKKVLTNLPHPPQKVLILIGPEGGFGSIEVERAKEKGFTPITLGNRILRTETVALSILSMFMYAYD